MDKRVVTFAFLSIFVAMLYASYLTVLPVTDAESGWIDTSELWHPQVRMIKVESIDNIFLDVGEDVVWKLPVYELNISFALNRVEDRSDYMDFKLWIGDGSAKYSSIGNFQLSFSTDYLPRICDLKGTGYLGSHLITAECPYKTGLIGIESYYYYRVHIWLDRDMGAGGTGIFTDKNNVLTVAAAYNKAPTIVEKNAVALSVKVVSDGLISEIKVDG